MPSFENGRVIPPPPVFLLLQISNSPVGKYNLQNVGCQYLISIKGLYRLFALIWREGILTIYGVFLMPDVTGTGKLRKGLAGASILIFIRRI